MNLAGKMEHRVCYEEDIGVWIERNLPDSLSIRSLKLYDYDGDRIGESIAQLPQLTHLSIYDCSPLKCVSNVTMLHNLQVLTIKGCYKLEELPANLGDLRNLTHFQLNGCRAIKCLPNSIVQLFKLSTLEVRSCDSLEELPSNLGDLRNLTHLDLSYCKAIKWLPNSIAQLSKLSTLKLESCASLEELPANLGELSMLSTLKVNNCTSLEALPANLNVVYLCLRECCMIKSLPQGLTNLQHLDLELCNFSEQRFGNFKEARKVTQLNISVCYDHPVDHIPRVLNEFVSLKRLSIQKHIFWSIMNIPSFAGLSNLQSLHVKAKVKRFPINSDELPQLFYLDLHKCSLKRLPCTIKNLVNLQFLFLPSDYRLETLPIVLKDSVIISVEERHIRKTWEEIKLEIGPLHVGDMLKDSAQYSSPLFDSGYLCLEDDLYTLIPKYYQLHSHVRILDLVLPDTVKLTGDVTGALPNLTHLYISGGDNYKCLFDTSTKLTHLSLCGCDLDYISDSLRKLPSLKSLRLFYVDKDEDEDVIPKALSLPCCLEHLTLLWFESVPVPDIMVKLSNLNTLELHRCYHVSLPENSNLTKLKLVNSYVDSLPTSLCHLEIIHDTNCCYEECDDDFQMCLNELVNLNTLSLTCCKVKFLRSLAVPQNLQKLLLKDCFNLRKLMPNMDKLVELCTLDISGTRIKSLPKCITMLPKLQHLVLPKCFKQKNLLSNSKVSIRFDCTDEMYYEDMGYYNSKYQNSDKDNETADEDTETFSEDNEINSAVDVVQIELLEGNTNVQSSSSRLPNPPEGPEVQLDFNISERNFLTGENSHQASRHLQNQEMEGLHTGVHSMEIVDDSNGEYQQMGTVNLGNAVNNHLAVIYSQSNNNPHGTQEKGRRQKIEITREQIQSLRDENLSLVEAGMKLRVSRSTMKRRCKELGLGRWPSSKKKKSNSCKKIIKTKSHTRGELSLPNMVQCSNPANPEYARESLDANQQNFFDQEARERDPIDKSIPKAKTDREVNVGSQSHMIVQESVPECTVGADAHSLLGTRIARMSTGNFPWPSDVPEFFLPYVKGWTDVRSDGNCGFRVIAEACYDEQEFWPHVRQAMCLEMEANRDQYSTLYGGSHGPREAISRISGHMYGQALPCY